MKYLLLLIIFSQAFTLSANSQSYNDHIQQAISFYQSEEYRQAGESFEKAFQLQEGVARDYYNAACAWSLAEASQAAIKNLRKSAESGWHDLELLEKDKDLENLHTLDAWKEVVAVVQANKEKYEINFDKPLKAQLEKMYMRDQTLRKLRLSAEEKFGRDSDEMQYFWSLIVQEDSLNQIGLMEILDSRGWPGKSLVGEKANIAAWAIIQHAPLSIQEKYLPMLQQSVSAGESQGNDLALLEDRILMRKGEKQKYGSQILINPGSGQPELHPIADPQNVNKRRAAVGLGPIEAYLKRWGIEFKNNP